MNAAAGTIRGEILGHIYFIGSGDRPFVKIGWTADPAVRLADLQCGNPDILQVLGTVPGTMADEIAWHRRFRHLSVRGEWFHLDDHLFDAILRREEVAAEIWSARQPEPPRPMDRLDRWIAEIKAARASAIPRGSLASNAVLDEIKVTAILGDHRSVRAVARDYGIGHTTVQDIRRRRTWRHVPLPASGDARTVAAHPDPSAHQNRRGL